MSAAGQSLPGSSAPGLAGRARDVLSLEWTKLWSVRSTWWMLIIAAGTAAGDSGLGSYVYSTAPLHPSPPGGVRLFSLVISLGALQYAVLAIGVLGVLSVSSEYASGLIRTTFTAVPRRRAVLAAKAAATGATALVAGELLAGIAFFLSQAILSGPGRSIGLSHPGVPAAILAAGAVPAACALLGAGLGAIIRHTAGAVTALAGLIYAPVIIYLTVPSPWNERIARFTLTGAAVRVASPIPLPGLLGPWPAALVLAGWPALALLAAAMLITRRDA